MHAIFTLPSPLSFPILPSNILSPSTPTQQKQLSPLNSIDPALYTPLKRMCLLSAAIGAMRSGSFLVSKAHVKSNQVVSEPVLEATPTIPEPDWLLLQQPVNLSTCTQWQNASDNLPTVFIWHNNTSPQGNWSTRLTMHSLLCSTFIWISSIGHCMRRRIRWMTTAWGCFWTSDETVEEVAKADAKKSGKKMDKETWAAQRARKKQQKIRLRWDGERWRLSMRKESRSGWLSVRGLKVKVLPSAVYPKSQRGHFMHILKRACQ